MTVYHVSEEPGIELFEPRPIDASGDSFVWAIDDEHLRNYLVPRECPARHVLRRTAYHRPRPRAVPRVESGGRCHRNRLVPARAIVP